MDNTGDLDHIKLYVSFLYLLCKLFLQRLQLFYSYLCYSGARGGGHELLPAEGGGHGQDQPGQEEDHRVQSQD